jgi:serine/threonine protein kinase
MTEVMGPLTASADIYSLAKTCYTMLCGRVPFEFNGIPITSLPSPADSETWAQEYLKILKRATAAEVVHRYGSVTEFWSELAALATFDPAATKALPFKRPTPEDSELAKKRVGWMPWLGVLRSKADEPFA